jgi:hypothetical protein
MVNDTINEFTSAISKRFGNPFVINFMFSWSFFNYKAILVMVSATPISQKLTVLEKEIWNSWWVITLCGFILPAIFTFIFLYLMPYLVTHLELFTAKIERERAIEKYKITKETPLSSEMAEKIQSENRELELQNKKLDYTVRVRENELSEEREKFKALTVVENQNTTKLTAERDALAAQVNAIRNERDTLNQELNEKRKYLESIEDSLANARGSIDAADVKIEELTKERDSLKLELMKLENSTFRLRIHEEYYMTTRSILSELITLFGKLPMIVKNDSKLFKEIDKVVAEYNALINSPLYASLLEDLSRSNSFISEETAKENFLLEMTNSKLSKEDKGSLGY